jgi:hypothetical protein
MHSSPRRPPPRAPMFMARIASAPTTPRKFANHEQPSSASSNNESHTMQIQSKNNSSADDKQETESRNDDSLIEYSGVFPQQK